ncbi:Dynein heavy chain family protein [Corchorus olitorius]|uniref:Dynein heavy chain family protein n=1 Tax=Corchorus olitorius TaxID=93759 RepID=A0A1R3GN69_9ROSI|nr:Dynein heavy chain family protein [Corchorus olitorius]
MTAAAVHCSSMEIASRRRPTLDHRAGAMDVVGWSSSFPDCFTSPPSYQIRHSFPLNLPLNAPTKVDPKPKIQFPDGGINRLMNPFFEYASRCFLPILFTVRV